LGVLGVKKFGETRNKSQVSKQIPTESIHSFSVVVGLVWSNDPESYAGSSVPTGRVSLAGQVKGDDPH
jgi:hypothetical protein